MATAEATIHVQFDPDAYDIIMSACNQLTERIAETGEPSATETVRIPVKVDGRDDWADVEVVAIRTAGKNGGM